MSDETRDPREAVLEDWRDAITARASMRSMNTEVDAATRILARLDAADPLRAMLGEVLAEMVEDAQHDPVVGGTWFRLISGTHAPDWPKGTKVVMCALHSPATEEVRR